MVARSLDLRSIALPLMALAAGLAAGEAGATASLAQVIPSGCSAPPATTASTRWRGATPATFASTLKTAQPGDIIVLQGGNYGAISLSGSNSSYVSIVGAYQQVPSATSLKVSGSNWLVQGVTLSGLAPPILDGPSGGLQWQAHPSLVNVNQANNVILEQNIVESQAGAFPWTAEIPGVADPHGASSGILVNNSSCVTLYKNSILNVFNGVQVGGNQINGAGVNLAVVGNVISDFAGDGIDHFGSNILIQGNTISNSHNICNELCVHTDGIQGWTYQDSATIINRNVVIDGNYITISTSPTEPLPGINLQGITIFDGGWRNVIITNNVIISNTWNGISIGGVSGLRIMNNTIIASQPGGFVPRIVVGLTNREGSPSNYTMVRNNISPEVAPQLTTNPTQNMAIDHNLSTVNWPPLAISALFNTANTATDTYDLRLRNGTAAVGRGSAAAAPLYDINGVPRTIPLDLGAYKFGD